VGSGNNYREKGLFLLIKTLRVWQTNELRKGDEKKECLRLVSLQER
jgi:hypothetical protein